jgi:hypothetical protein
VSKNEKELLEKQVIAEAKSGWRRYLYKEAKRRRKEDDPEASEETVDKWASEAVEHALETSLGVKKSIVRADLAAARGKGVPVRDNSVVEEVGEEEAIDEE